MEIVHELTENEPIVKSGVGDVNNLETSDPVNLSSSDSFVFDINDPESTKKSIRLNGGHHGYTEQTLEGIYNMCSQLAKWTIAESAEEVKSKDSVVIGHDGCPFFRLRLVLVTKLFILFIYFEKIS